MEKSSLARVVNPRPGSQVHKLREMKPGEEWWEVRTQNSNAPTSRECAFYIDARRAGVVVEVTRHRALSWTSDEVTHLVRVRKICDVMEA